MRELMRLDGSRGRTQAWFSALAALLLAACHRGSAPTADALARVGTFDYVANIGRYEMRGVLFVLPDTILVKPGNEFCQLPREAPSQETMRYECVGIQDYDHVLLRIDRHSPLTASKWTAYYTVRRQRTVCAQYTVDTRGRTVCVQYRTETYEEPHTLTGMLRLRVRPAESGSAEPA
jgi:hypothetical protein